MEASAKTNENVEKTFILAAKMLYKIHLTRIKEAKQKQQDRKNGSRLKNTQANNAAANKQSCGC